MPKWNTFWGCTWWSSCTLYLHARLVTVTFGHSGLCCMCDFCGMWLIPFVDCSGCSEELCVSLSHCHCQCLHALWHHLWPVPEVRLSFCVDYLTVSVQPPPPSRCPIADSHALMSVCILKILNAGSNTLFGHTTVLHTLIEMGNAVLVAAVLDLGEVTQISCKRQSTENKYQYTV